MLEVKYEIRWSIYIAGKNVQKVRNKHLPAVNEAIELPDQKWEVFVEEDNPNEVRMCSSSFYDGFTKAEMTLDYLRWLPQLAAGEWGISGLSTIHSDRALYLCGMFYTREPKNGYPAVTNVMAELIQCRAD
ncbi:MAG: hypothetical protein QNJ29_13705 [Rhizobiaceae bacterium]|nr:hypothetical protein [Rhizobiaceae bacterium]